MLLVTEQMFNLILCKGDMLIVCQLKAWALASFIM